MRGRDLLSLADLSPDEVRQVLDGAATLKSALKAGKPHAILTGRSLAMLFEKPSLRTRTTFAAGMAQLGGTSIDLMDEHMQMGVRETVPDIARNLERWVDAIMARVYQHETLAELAANASVPVINGLSDRFHPCQVLGDLLTVRERFGELAGRTLAYVGDGYNVCHSLLLGCALSGMHVRCATPRRYAPHNDVVRLAERLADAEDGTVAIGTDPSEAVNGADVVYTDSWVSMGTEAEAATRHEVFAPYQVDAELMARAGADAIFMHCLPAHRGQEVTDEVMDSAQSAVFDQAENRLHAQKALLVLLVRGGAALSETGAR